MREYRNKSKDAIKIEINAEKRAAKEKHANIESIITDTKSISGLYRKLQRDSLMTRDANEQINAAFYKCFSTTRREFKKKQDGLKPIHKNINRIVRDMCVRSQDAYSNANLAGKLEKNVTGESAKSPIKRVKRIAIGEAKFLGKHSRIAIEINKESGSRQRHEARRMSDMFFPIDLKYIAVDKPMPEEDLPPHLREPLKNKPLDTGVSEQLGYIPTTPEGYKTNDILEYKKGPEYNRDEV